MAEIKDVILKNASEAFKNAQTAFGLESDEKLAEMCFTLSVKTLAPFYESMQFLVDLSTRDITQIERMRLYEERKSQHTIWNKIEWQGPRSPRVILLSKTRPFTLDFRTLSLDSLSSGYDSNEYILENVITSLYNKSLQDSSFSIVNLYATSQVNAPVSSVVPPKKKTIWEKDVISRVGSGPWPETLSKTRLDIWNYALRQTTLEWEIDMLNEKRKQLADLGWDDSNANTSGFRECCVAYYHQNVIKPLLEREQDVLQVVGEPTIEELRYYIFEYYDGLWKQDISHRSSVLKRIIDAYSTNTWSVFQEWAALRKPSDDFVAIVQEEKQSQDTFCSMKDILLKAYRPHLQRQLLLAPIDFSPFVQFCLAYIEPGQDIAGYAIQLASCPIPGLGTCIEDPYLFSTLFPPGSPLEALEGVREAISKQYGPTFSAPLITHVPIDIWKNNAFFWFGDNRPKNSLVCIDKDTKLQYDLEVYTRRSYFQVASPPAIATSIRQGEDVIIDTSLNQPWPWSSTEVVYTCTWFRIEDRQQIANQVAVDPHFRLGPSHLLLGHYYAIVEIRQQLEERVLFTCRSNNVIVQ